MEPGDCCVFETSGPNMCFHAGAEREVRNGGTRKSIDFRVIARMPEGRGKGTDVYISTIQYGQR